MPSRDPINPDANKWMDDDGIAPVRRSQPVRKRTKRDMSTVVLRLARRLGVNAEALASRIPPDTLRRSKYPVIEDISEDGKVTYRHDPGIVEGRRSEVRP